MATDARVPRFLRFARALALVSGAVLPMGCADTIEPGDSGFTGEDAGIVADGGGTVDHGPPIGIAVDAGVIVRDVGIAALDLPPPGLRVDDVPPSPDHIFVGIPVPPDAGITSDPDAGVASSGDAAAPPPDVIDEFIGGGPTIPPEFDEDLA